jgi:hypothetical protein
VYNYLSTTIKDLKMAYISKEDATRMRNALKFVFPAKDGWKVGFRNMNSTKASVTLKKGLFDVDKKEDYQLNAYHSNTSEKNEDIFRNIVVDTLEVAVDYYNNSDIMTDYHDVAYYKSITIGEFGEGKEYQYNPKIPLDWSVVKQRVKKLAILKELKK